MHESLNRNTQKSSNKAYARSHRELCQQIANSRTGVSLRADSNFNEGGKRFESVRRLHGSVFLFLGSSPRDIVRRGANHFSK